MTKSDPNIHQNAPNCTILKIFSGGACPRISLAKRMTSPCAACRFATCKFPNLKKKFLGPPLPNPRDAPAISGTRRIVTGVDWTIGKTINYQIKFLKKKRKSNKNRGKSKTCDQKGPLIYMQGRIYGEEGSWGLLFKYRLFLFKFQRFANISQLKTVHYLLLTTYPRK